MHNYDRRIASMGSLLSKLIAASNEGQRWLHWPGHYDKAIGVLADAAQVLVEIMGTQGQKTGPAQNLHKQMRALQKYIAGRIKTTGTPPNDPGSAGSYGPVMMGREPGTWVHEDKEINQMADSVGWAFQKLRTQATIAKRATPGSADFWEGVAGVAGSFTLNGVKERTLNRQLWELMENPSSV